jgi:hypothetical protein
MTIARQLKITTFPFDIKNEQGKLIYTELSNGYWCIWEYDQDGNVIYTKDSDGYILDKRPKPKPEPVKKQTAVEWYRNTFFKALQEGLTISESEIYSQAKAMEEEQHQRTYHAKLNKHYFDFDHYYNETYGGDK